MNHLVRTLETMPMWMATLLLLAENVVILALALWGAHLLKRRFAHRPVSPAPRPLEKTELALAAITVLLNTAVTVVGLGLWRAGLIEFREDTGWRAWLDVPLLLLVMDLAMYFLHRIAHIKWIFPILHGTHHQYKDLRPLTLFVLNPAEAVSFGLLWLAVISIYDASWLGMSVYLALNVAFGAIGHLGVEPLPDGWKRMPVLNYLSTSTFHAQHHRDREHNFGFYTLIWDKLFGTLSPRYEADFGRLSSDAA
jgi:Delta7-sterol 5-desaturase